MTTRDRNLIESGIAALILSGDCRMMVLGDSTVNPNTIASADDEQCALYQAIYRTWDADWKGVAFGGTSGQGLNQVNPGGSVSTTVRDPDDAFTNGQTAFNIMPRQDNVFAATVADNTALLGNRVIPASGANPFAAVFADVEVTCRMAALRHATGTGGAASVTYQTRRVDSSGASPSIKNETAAQTLAGATGVVVFSEVCPVHGGGTKPYPDARLLMEGAGNATGMDACTIISRFWVDAMATGLELQGAGVGGADTSDWLDPDDSDSSAGSAYIHDDILAGIIGATQTNLFLIYLSANDGTLNAAWRTRYEKLIERLAAAATANGITAKFLLVTQHACTNFARFKSDTQWAAIENIIDSGGTSSHGSLGGVTYGVVAAERIGAINLAQAQVERGIVAGEQQVDGTWDDGSNNGAVGDGTYMFDLIHRTRIGADYDAETIWNVLNDPTDAAEARLQGNLRSHLSKRRSIMGA